MLIKVRTILCNASCTHIYFIHFLLEKCVHDAPRGECSIWCSATATLPRCWKLVPGGATLAPPSKAFSFAAIQTSNSREGWCVVRQDRLRRSRRGFHKFFPPCRPSSSLAASLGRAARWGGHRSLTFNNLQPFRRAAGWFQSDAQRSQDG